MVRKDGGALTSGIDLGLVLKDALADPHGPLLIPEQLEEATAFLTGRIREAVNIRSSTTPSKEILPGIAFSLGSV